ncbi:MAG: YqgE/AlgH family protein [Hyphomicrobiales bacterium]|nr:YqgE/AlgH family protein [Hyphomicrobiales bacterium]
MGLYSGALQADPGPSIKGSLAGQLLVASPKMGDPRFAKTVIYVMAQDSEGAIGLVVNRPLGEGPLEGLLSGFGIKMTASNQPIHLNYGGPVETGRGFVLHSDDYRGRSTHSMTNGIAVSTGRDVLEAAAAGNGPQDLVFVLGYAGWSAGQLEKELARDDWLTAPADASLIFTDDFDHMWERAMMRAGIEL